MKIPYICLVNLLKAYLSKNSSEVVSSPGPEWDEINKINVKEFMTRTHNSFFITH